MNNTSRIIFKLAGLVALVAIVTAVYLDIRIEMLDAQILVEKDLQRHLAVSQAADNYRSFFREKFWLIPLLACVCSLFGWIEYFSLDRRERSWSLVWMGIAITLLSLLLLGAIGGLFILAGGH